MLLEIVCLTALTQSSTAVFRTMCFWSFIGPLNECKVAYFAFSACSVPGTEHAAAEAAWAGFNQGSSAWFKSCPLAAVHGQTSLEYAVGA